MYYGGCSSSTVFICWRALREAVAFEGHSFLESLTFLGERWRLLQSGAAELERPTLLYQIEESALCWKKIPDYCRYESMVILKTFGNAFLSLENS